jgi:hypothetical protein
MTAQTMRRRTDSTGTLPLAALSRSERQTLRMLERDWPDSVGLMARAALHARESDQRTLAMVRAGICAYRRSWKGGADDTARFAAFVEGITEVLAREKQRCVAEALSEAQRWVLARCLPPERRQDVG